MYGSERGVEPPLHSSSSGRRHSSRRTVASMDGSSSPSDPDPDSAAAAEAAAAAPGSFRVSTSSLPLTSNLSMLPKSSCCRVALLRVYPPGGDAAMLLVPPPPAAGAGCLAAADRCCAAPPPLLPPPPVRFLQSTARRRLAARWPLPGLLACRCCLHAWLLLLLPALLPAVTARAHCIGAMAASLASGCYEVKLKLATESSTCDTARLDYSAGGKRAQGGRSRPPVAPVDLQKVVAASGEGNVLVWRLPCTCRLYRPLAGKRHRRGLSDRCTRLATLPQTPCAAAQRPGASFIAWQDPHGMSAGSQPSRSPCPPPAMPLRCTLPPSGEPANCYPCYSVGCASAAAVPPRRPSRPAANTRVWLPLPVVKCRMAGCLAACSLFSRRQPPTGCSS